MNIKIDMRVEKPKLKKALGNHRSISGLYYRWRGNASYDNPYRQAFDVSYDLMNLYVRLGLLEMNELREFVLPEEK